MDKVPIATKVDRNSKLMLEAIAERAGLKVYNLLQTIVDSYLRYLAPNQIVTEYTDKLVHGFFNFQLAKDSFSLCEPDAGKRDRFVDSAILFVEKPNKPQPRPILVHKKTDSQGNAVVYESIKDDDILVAFFRAFSPSVLVELKQIKEENKLLSLADALIFAVHEQITPMRYDITADIESEFKDNERDEWGKAIDLQNTRCNYIVHRTRSLANIQ